MILNQVHVLLADDDNDDCNFFKLEVKKLPVLPALTIVRDGDGLMQYLEDNAEHLPSVLFLDINMPRKNGFECLAEIRLNKNLQTLPVIVFSTSYEREVVHALHAAGAQYFIRKPSDYDRFAGIILHALNLIRKTGYMQPLLTDFVIQEIA